MPMRRSRRELLARIPKSSEPSYLKVPVYLADETTARFETRAEFAAVREEIERLRAEVRRSRRLVSAVRKHERALRHPQAGLGPARRAILAALDATPLTAAP